MEAGSCPPELLYVCFLFLLWNSGLFYFEGCTLMAESKKLRPGHSLGLTAFFYKSQSSEYQNPKDNNHALSNWSPHTQNSEIITKVKQHRMHLIFKQQLFSSVCL